MNATTRTVVVTGAMGGIGKATASRFAESGAKLVLSDQEDSVVRVAADLASTHPDSEAAGIVTDVTDPAECAALMQAAVERHGGLDVLIVAGAVLQGKAPLADLDPAEWDRVMAVNAKGPFLLAKSAIPLLPKPGGRIIFLGSFSGEIGQQGLAAYSASKGAVRILTQSLALELASDGITVNCVAPAYVESPLATQAMEAAAKSSGKTLEEVLAQRNAGIPLGRQATAAEIAETMVFLASPGASYVTGSCLDVNGGVVLR